LIKLDQNRVADTLRNTAWQDFERTMNAIRIEPEVVMPLALIEPFAPAMDFESGGQNWIQNNTTVQMSEGQDPMQMLRASRHLDALGAR
jgi:hypothetical protein